MPRPSPSSQPSLLGTLIDSGRLRLVADLGSGSFAQVYRAELTDSSSNPRQFAVKVLYKPGLSQTQLKTQQNEVRFLKALADHPNVCKLLKSIETETQLFLIMELCDTDLFDLIVPPNTTKGTRQGLPEPTVLSIFGQLASVLAYSHSKGIYHRDLKPENILLLRSSMSVKLADFGLATHAKISKEFGCGSVRYMSPECLDSKLSPEGYSPEMNDVWSLGIILINLLTGKNPWVEPRSTDINYSLYLSEQQALSTLKNQFKLSHELATVLSRVFSPDRSRRLSLQAFAESVMHLPYLRAPTMPLPSPPISIPALSNSPPRISPTAIGPFSWSHDASEVAFSAAAFQTPPGRKYLLDTTQLPPLTSNYLVPEDS